MRTLRLIAIVLVVAPAFGKVIVGDKPQLKTRAMDGSTIDLSAYAGKMVIVDFFGKSDMSQRHEELVLDIFKRNSDKGLAVIGICVERKPSDAVDVVRELRLPWPVILEPAGFTGGLCKEWGLPILPSSYLIGPDGDVLVVQVRTLESTVATEMIKHPPVLVAPAVVASANAQLDAVEKALAENDHTKAVKLSSKIPADASKNADFAKRLASDRKKLSDAADELVANAQTAIDAKDFIKASTILKDLVSMSSGLPAEASAKQKLAELMAKPEVKEQLKTVEREAAANAALAEARKLRDGRRDVEAYTKFKGVAVDYAGTDAGAEAATAVKAYEADAEFMRHYKEDAVAAKAKSALGLADSYHTAGRLEQARKKYQEVIDQYPGTSFADQAKAALASMK